MRHIPRTNWFWVAGDEVSRENITTDISTFLPIVKLKQLPERQYDIQGKFVFIPGQTSSTTHAQYDAPSLFSNRCLSYLSPSVTVIAILRKT